MDIRKMKSAVIGALEEIKAKNILMLNVSKLTSLFDYLVIASGDSNRQTKALANNVKERLKQAGATVYGAEGEQVGEWVLVDFGDMVVHVMQPAIRDYYRLEELWRDGKIEYPKPGARKAAAPRLVKAEQPATRKKAASGIKAKPGTRKKTASGIKAKPGTRKKAASGIKAKPGTRKKTASGIKAKPGTRKKTAQIKTTPKPKVKTGAKTGAKAKTRTGAKTPATTKRKTKKN
jgi:ribosome-associated protein